MVIVLLNMLIAMINSSFQEIEVIIYQHEIFEMTSCEDSTDPIISHSCSLSHQIHITHYITLTLLPCNWMSTLTTAVMGQSLNYNLCIVCKNKSVKYGLNNIQQLKYKLVHNKTCYIQQIQLLLKSGSVIINVSKIYFLHRGLMG